MGFDYYNSNFFYLFFYGVGYCGYLLATRRMKDSNYWKKAIEKSNYEATHRAAMIMKDEAGYDGDATLDYILKDTSKKLNEKDKKANKNKTNKN